jgi:hypothetical protein
MKKIQIAFFLMIIPFVFFHCSGEEVPSVVLYDGLELWSNPGVEHITILTMGDKVFSSTNEKEISDSQNNPMSLIEIRLNNGLRGWILKKWIVQNAQPAAVLKDTGLYKSANKDDSLGIRLSRTDIVAVYYNIEPSDFAEIAVYKQDNGFKNHVYVLKNELTFEKADIAVAKLILKYKRSNDTTEKDEMIELVNKNYPDSVFFDDFEQAKKQDENSISSLDLNKLIKDSLESAEEILDTIFNPDEAADLSFVKYNAKGTTNETTVMVDSPDLKSITETVSVEKGTQVKITGRTKDEASLKDMVAYWYEVELASGEKGWIYGYYIDIVN